MKTNENEGSVAASGDAVTGFTTLQNTPGMGDVVMPTVTTKGSGDTWGNVLDFNSWKKRKRKKRKSKRS